MPRPCPGPHESGHPPAVDVVWCPRCAQICRSALRALPDAYLALDAVRFLTASQPADAPQVTGTRDRPSPAPGADLRDEIFHTSRSWEDDLRQHLHHRAARDGDTREETLTRTVRYLNRNFDTMIVREVCAKDFGQEMLWLFTASLRMVKNGPTRRVLIIPCPSCHRRSLIQQEGIALKPWYTSCEERLGGCGRLFTETEMAWATEVQLATVR